jgi:hypothetical protein
MKINSKGNKVLIFSDVHQNIEKFTKIISHEKADINICLGDWFDSFFLDSDSDCASASAELKEEFLSKPNNITLFGNHDLHYFFNNKYTYCSGYENRKRDIIKEALGKDMNKVVDSFKWFVFIDEYLCTHAGLSNDFLSPTIQNNEDVYEYLANQVNDANIKIRTDQLHWFYGAGKARGGTEKKGGLVWLDFDREFAPIEGLKQIVGHTYRKSGKVTEWRNTGNYCIDTDLNEWVTITNGKFEIKNYKDL